MAEVIRFETAEGASVIVEAADEQQLGLERVSRASDGLLTAAKSLDQALGTARSTIASAMAAFDGLGLEELSLEFGLKLNAEVGGMLAKAGGEAQLTVTATWGRQPQQGSAPG